MSKSPRSQTGWASQRLITANWRCSSREEFITPPALGSHREIRYRVHLDGRRSAFGGLFSAGGIEIDGCADERLDGVISLTTLHASVC